MRLWIIVKLLLSLFTKHKAAPTVSWNIRLLFQGDNWKLSTLMCFDLFVFFMERKWNKNWPRMSGIFVFVSHYFCFNLTSILPKKILKFLWNWNSYLCKQKNWGNFKLFNHLIFSLLNLPVILKYNLKIWF